MNHGWHSVRVGRYHPECTHATQLADLYRLRERRHYPNDSVWVCCTMPQSGPTSSSPWVNYPSTDLYFATFVTT
jgi:hypothetical protein